MVGTGTIHNTQALAIGINLVQGDPYRFAILGRDQRNSRAEHIGEPRLDFKQQGQRGFTNTEPHSIDTGTVKIKGLVNTRHVAARQAAHPARKNLNT